MQWNLKAIKLYGKVFPSLASFLPSRAGVLAIESSIMNFL